MATSFFYDHYCDKPSSGPSLAYLSIQSPPPVSFKPGTAIPTMITEPLDLTNPDDSLLRRLARQSLENTASPMFLIKNFGFEQLLQSVIARASSENTCLSDGKSHFDLKTEHTQDDPLFDEFRDEMKALATRVATILFGEESAAGVQLDGPLSVKSYVGESDESRTDDIRLGAHVDGNMFTILWSNAPGLQVLKPEKNVNAEDLMFYGNAYLPSSSMCVAAL